MDPWHDVEVGDNAPEFVNGIIEIPRGSKAKYELDKKTGMICLDRVLYAAVHYPANYGFIPRTYCDDNDPLDILVLSQIDLVPLCLAESKVIGVMKMVDGGEQDDKIIAVAKEDMAYAHYNDISELPPLQMKEIVAFFTDYKNLENKKVEVTGVAGREEALKIVNQSIVDYNKRFGE